MWNVDSEQNQHVHFTCIWVYKN